jgi:hypothetical protein
MGHRALVAYERTDGQYNLHYSHWGANDLRLKHTITEATPFGGEAPTEQAHQAIDALAEGENVQAVLDEYGRVGSVDVDIEPRVVGVTMDEAVTEWLDFLQHEAFFVVSPAFDVTAYRTLWFGLCFESEVVQDSPAIGHGALRTVRWYQGAPVNDGYTRGAFVGTKRAVADMVDRGVFSQGAALDYLEGAVESAACQHESIRIHRSD